MTNNGREHKGPRRGHPDIGASSSAGYLNSSCCGEAGWKAAKEFRVSTHVNKYASLDWIRGPFYFSSMVFVLVTTSPYMMFLPKSSFAVCVCE